MAEEQEQRMAQGAASTGQAPASPEARTWRGKWCWTRKHLARPWNYYAYFRKTIELSSKPQRARIRISAQARYTLYVNGRRIHQGPARSYPQFQSFDTLDLAGHLQAGKNTLCAIVHEFGVPTFQSVFRDISGFLVDGVIETDNQPIALHTPEGWLCRPARGWRKDVTRLSVQLGFQEHFDADADPADWMDSSYEPKESDGWAKPWVAGPVGTHPWLNMEPRGVPLLADHQENFSEVLGLFGGENARGYKITDDVYRLPTQEKHARGKGTLDNPQAMLKDDDAVTTVPPPADGQFVTAVLDLGTYRTGHIILDIAEAAGDEIIDVLYAETVDEKTKFPVIQPGGGSEVATADRYRCRPGRQRWEAYFPKGLRYAALIFRNVEKPLQVRYVGLRQVHAGFSDIGAFECSDQVLNQIWQVARTTQKNCAFDAFVDCPWREQAQWWGDARVQAHVTAYAFGDTSLLERGIRQVAQSQAADGSLHAHPPSDSPHRLPDFMLTWIGTLWDHYGHTGRDGLIRQCLPALHRLLGFFASHEVKDGLIGNFEGWWVFLDWKNLHKENASAVLNLMYLQGLRWATNLCRIGGDSAAAERYAAKAAELASAIERYFWDAEAKMWRDGHDLAQDKPVELYSQHAGALAILLDLKPETHAGIARDVLLKAARTKRGKIIEASPFFYAYVLEAMVKAGLRAEVVEIIKDKWGEMIDKGAVTFWEVWDGVGSRCHAWSASPLYHLSQQVLGVVPTEPGWKRVRIAPLPAGLDFARGVVPSPLGPIRVEWEKVEEDQLAVRVDLPPGMNGEFIGLLGESRALGPGGHEFHT